MRKAFLLTFALTVLQTSLCCAQSDPLAIHIALSKTTVILGEPLWVDVTITNHSSQTTSVSWGSTCCGSVELAVKIPEALQVPKPKSCGTLACSCMIAGPSVLAPGQSESRRYVLQGDFRITHTGHYTVMVSKDVPYATTADTHQVMLPQNHLTQTETLETAFEVTPPDSAKLLALEQSLSAEAAATYKQPALNIPINSDHDAYMAAVRAWSDGNRKASAEFYQAHHTIYEGIAAYPVAGMELVFMDWETPPHSVGFGIAALQHLNTPAARAALAHLAEPVMDRYVNGYKQSNSRWSALRALGSMGDRSYLPLIESYMNDPDQEVRRAAIFATDELGGTPFLEGHKNTNQVECNEDVVTIGR